MNSHNEYEQFDVKHEVDPMPMVAIKSEPQTEGTKESLDKLLEGYEKSDNKQKNVKDELNTVFVKIESCESNEIDLDEDKFMYTSDNREENAEGCLVYKSSVEHDDTKALSEETEDRRLKCNICNNFSYGHTLNVGETSFICNTCCEILPQTSGTLDDLTCRICTKTFANKRNQISHMFTHTGEKPFKCGVCSKSFSKKSYLAVHMRTHTGENLYRCRFCNKSTPKKYDHEAHERTHTGEKPFECTLCNKAFSQKPHLVFHMRTHSSERAFVCNFCNKGFSLECNLNKHIKYCHVDGNSFMCNLCNKSFLEKRALDVHTRTHTGEKPFKCDFCIKSFSQKSNLIVHMRSHTGEKPFTCNFCEKSFTDKRYLVAHVRMHNS